MTVVQRVVDSKYVLVNANAPGGSLFFFVSFLFLLPLGFYEFPRQSKYIYIKTGRYKIGYITLCYIIYFIKS